MRHQYELLKVSLLTSLFSCICLWLNYLVIKTDSLHVFKDSATLIFGIVSLILVGSVLMVLLVTGYWLAKGYGIGNLWRSLWITFAIRQYCHLVTSDQLALTEETRLTATNKVNKRANRSLHTLNVLFTKDTATLTWHLPYNHESKALLVALFPTIKTELNQLARSYVFNDITNVRNNLYQATAYQV